MAVRSGSIVGIDFGTSTSFVATPADGIVSLGQRDYLPSVAGVLDRRLLVGDAAMALPPDRIIRSAKRAITDGQTHLPVGGRYAKSQRPRDQVIVAILKELKVRARRSGVALKPNDVVRLACPAEWTRDMRQLLLDLAKQAGLPTRFAEMFEEPVSAGVDWLDRQLALDFAHACVTSCE